jgi:hypothetical protein
LFIVLKNGFKFQGECVSETPDEIILNDYKLGEITIKKEDISVRGDGNHA